MRLWHPVGIGSRVSDRVSEPCHWSRVTHMGESCHIYEENTVERARESI